MTDDDPADEAGAEALRTELRAWLGAHLTPEVREAIRYRQEGTSHVVPFEALREWNATLFDGGWAAPSWPAMFGGRDAGILEQLAFNEEMAAAGAPGPVNAIGVANIAPAILTYGTPEQQER
ncbi:MAG TPA: acyl-CoA dehydrogenase family protein, partial [Aquihabitans sp.]|nr:acyl-CoA dehydrogenase family protein [Aquihabitans sp.]